MINKFLRRLNRSYPNKSDAIPLIELLKVAGKQQRQRATVTKTLSVASQPAADRQL
jgi:hypothetical protein